MVNRITVTNLAFACVFSCGAAAVAQEPPRPSQSSPATRSRSMPQEAGQSGDQMFVRKAAAGGMAEVELAMLAMQRSTSDPVKRLAQRIESDHKRANAELKSIASSRNLSMEPEPMPDHAAAKTRLEKLSGASFDRAYLDTMVKDHQKTIKEFERQASAGSDAELKAFAAKTLPDLKAHLQMTMDAQKGMRSSQQ